MSSSPQIYCDLRASGVSSENLLGALNTFQNWSQASLNSTLSQKHTHTLILKCENEFVGFAILQLVAGEGEILSIYVNPAYRGRNYATLLLKEFKAKQGQELEKLFLEVRSTNTAAIRFYTKYGFKNMGTRKSYYDDGTDALIMMLEIQDS